MDLAYEHFVSGFQQAVAESSFAERRIGAELKFPLVCRDGRAVKYETVRALWEYLHERDWQFIKDGMTGEIVGAKKPGEHNDTVASCETGYCTAEFSLAHVADLFELERSIRELQGELRPFAEQHDVHFLGCGIQPVTRPSRELLMKQARTSVWKKVLRPTRGASKEKGRDVSLFTINAATHVHVSVTMNEVIPALNVLNGFSGAQIALTANSNIWLGGLDPNYRCVAEKFWDWWMPDSDRVGVPKKPFKGLKDYVRAITSLRPVFVKRAGKPIVLRRYRTFREFYGDGRAVGVDTEGREVSFVPKKADLALHNSCYWYTARLSRYFTVENRVNDQQPPEDMLCVPALTVGLVSVMREAEEELSRFDWDDLRAARDAACRDAIHGSTSTFTLSELAETMLRLATLGLRRRGLGEEMFIAPLWKRFHERTCPADDAARLFEDGGIEALVAERAFCALA